MPRWRAKRCRHPKASRCEGPSVNGHVAVKWQRKAMPSHKSKWRFTYLNYANLDCGAE